MKHFIYAIFVCLLMLTGCNNEEPGYGYKDPVVYFREPAFWKPRYPVMKFRYQSIAAAIRTEE